jgi:hypothetical protein
MPTNPPKETKERRADWAVGELGFTRTPSEDDPRRDPGLLEAIAKVAPGTTLRQAVDDVIRSHEGALIVIGDPVELAEYERDTPLHPHALAEGTDAVMDRLAEMLSELRNVPAPAERWNPSAHGQNETGRLDT